METINPLGFVFDQDADLLTFNQYCPKKDEEQVIVLNKKMCKAITDWMIKNDIVRLD